jgi:hypothetical protein
MEIENFFPKYPNIFQTDYETLNPYDESFEDVIVNKKEFHMLKLDKTENKVKKKGEAYLHQKIISRFLSSFTPYNELLLFHEMGTGKTCTAITTIEKLRYESHSHINGAIICTKGTALHKTFKRDLLFTCTDGRYIPDNYENLTPIERAHRNRKILSEFYTFNTFEIFAKDLAKMTDDYILKKYSNKIIVIDEVHNLREKDKTDNFDSYKEFYRLCHLVKRSKILLMSGTVMKDDVSEFASVMNLILPLNQQFLIDQDFTKFFFKNYNFDYSKKDIFINKIKGRVSYLKSNILNVKKILVGTSLGNLKHFKVFVNTMSEFQTEGYMNAHHKDRTEHSIYINSRQAALFVFPDGTYGKEGYMKYVKERNATSAVRNRGRPTKGQITEIVYSLNFLEQFKLTGSNEEKLNNLSVFSIKFAETIRQILKKKSKYLVYCEFVKGGGCIMFAKILEQFGFSLSSGNDKSKKPRYIILTHKTTNDNSLEFLINSFNSSENIDGEYISVVIGSRTISEGFTFKNIRKEFILTPHWNYSETTQVIARGWRINSHQDLITRGDDNLTVKIYQHVAVPFQKEIKFSIDLYMYEISEKKDVEMKQLEHLIKLAAFDCPLTYDRNYIMGYDNQRECEYTTCDYTCSGTQTEIDVNTYNLFFTTYHEMEYKLKDYFRHEFNISYNNLYDMFFSLDKFEIIKCISYFINNDTKFINKYGFSCYLRSQNDIIYITPDSKIINGDIFANYYAKQLIITKHIPFKTVSHQIYQDSLPNIIEIIFDQPNHYKLYIDFLPEEVRLLILQACIQAKSKKINKNTIIRDRILDFYKGWYDFIDGEWITWLYKNEFGAWVLRKNLWIKYDNMEVIDSHIFSIKKKFLESPIGYYGLYNPQMDDFCIRCVKDLKKQKDSRKITIGKRCVDWDIPTLIDIAVRLAPLKTPSNFMSDETVLSLKAKTMVNKYYKEGDENDEDQMRRLLFWSNKIRKELCVNIQHWFDENDLIEENFDCGTQKKQRLRFLQ